VKMQDNWSANIYSQFLDLRNRPIRDLLAAIPEGFAPKTIIDLGCGPGNSTILLKQRFADTVITGIDTSSAMLDEAAQKYLELKFIKQDIKEFNSIEPIDLIFASASLQCLGDHELLLPKLCNMLSANGAFAMLMPNNFHAPSHQFIIKVLQTRPDWQPLTSNLLFKELEKPLYDPITYYDLLIKAGMKKIIGWQTEYFQEMTNHQEIFNWLKGTSLAPILSNMDKSSQEQFAESYVKAIEQEYTLQINSKLLMPYLRIFAIGIK
jgi:trans-aconitate 2-methyltransferase